MKKAKKKIKAPSAKTLRGRRSAPSKPFRLEVGKTYETEDGSIRVKIVSIELDLHPSWAATGKVVNGDVRGYGAYWHADGLYHPKNEVCREAWLDLVREVKPPKAPIRKARVK